MLHARSLFITALAFCVGGSLCAQSGAIFTTDQNAVNSNYFKSTDAAYVSQSGLPNGTYYFQVTDLAGNLMSSDKQGQSARWFEVLDGNIVDASHDTGDAGKGKKGGGSANSVALAPFDTNSPNDVYKVWVALQTDYVNAGNKFLPTDSKTDNFKVQKGKPIAQSSITGTVFYDTDEDNWLDTGEFGLAGWRVELRKKGEAALLQVDFTAEGGGYEFLVPLDDTDPVTYVVTVLAPVFDATGSVITNRADGFIGESSAARWLASTGYVYPDPVANVESVDGPDFGNVYFVPADTTAAGSTVYGIGFWHASGGKAIIQANETTWRNMLTTVDNPWPAGSRPVAPTNYINDDALFQFRTKANECLAADSVTHFLRDNLGAYYYPLGSDDFETAFTKFSNWIVANDLGNGGFKLSREMAAALCNVKLGSLAGTTVYINTDPSSGLANLASFDEITYKAVCLLLTPKAETHATDSNATLGWLTLRNAILTELGGTDPYPFDLRLGRASATDSLLHPFIRRPQPKLVPLKLVVPGMTKQFSQINTTTEPAEDEAYVWEPEPNPEEDGAVPVPAEPYGGGIG